MKKIIFFFFGFFLLFSPAESFAEEKIFSGIYDRVGNTLDEKASKVVAGMIGTDADLVSGLVLSQSFVMPENDTTLLEVCRQVNDGSIADGEGLLTKAEENRCVSTIESLWKKERKNIEMEALHFEQSVVFSRWWDGVTDGKNDFDILADIEKMEQQFFGSDEESLFVPRPSLGNQKLFSLAENGYRLPMDELPFESLGGCAPGETSLYGGIMCVPDFCTDFACIKITAVPGRKASESSCGNEANFENIFCELENIGFLLNDVGDITPTKHQNNSFFNTQVFDKFQSMQNLMTIETRVPPIISEFIPPDENSKTKQPPASSTNETTEKPSGTDAEKQDRMKEFETEFQRVRGKNVFNLCQENPSECSSIDVLDSLMFDCSVELGTLPGGDQLSTLQKCMSEQSANLERVIESDWQENQKAIAETKTEFYENIPKDLNTLWASIISFERTLDGINECRIQQATLQCGSEKKQCENYTLK